MFLGALKKVFPLNGRVKPQWSNKYEFVGDDLDEDDSDEKYYEGIDDEFNLDFLIKDTLSSDSSEQSEDIILNPHELSGQEEDSKKKIVQIVKLLNIICICIFLIITII